MHGTIWGAFFGRSFRLPIYSFEAGESSLEITDYIRETTKAVKKIRKRLKTGQCQQKSYAN